MALQDFSAVVYRARTEALAEHLVRKLGKISIEAVVRPERLVGMEPGDAGYAVCVRAVDQPSAEKATRLFVEDYLNKRLTVDEEAAGNEAVWDNESSESITHWPVCPTCESPRLARCTICGQLGVGFPPNDPDFNWGLGLDEGDEADDEGAPRCACKGDTCVQGDLAEDVHLPEEPACQREPHEGDIVLRCTRCDEAFAPAFADRCPWCDYRFNEGFELAAPETELPENAPRVALALGVLLLLCAGFVLYFLYVFR